MTRGRVLIIAGSDSGGGAGIQGDLKTVTVLGGYGMTAITALTAQNTTEVQGIHAVPGAFIEQQMRLCLDDIGADAIKTGMLHTAEVIDTVADTLQDYPPLPFVLDPVMVAKGGQALLEASAEVALKQRLLPLASLITPNIPEAERLAGQRIESLKDMQAAGEKLLSLGAKAVLMKGGHLEGEMLTDLLLTPQGILWQQSNPRLPTRHTHGTGCSYASAIATGLAQGLRLETAVSRAYLFVQQAIRLAPGLGSGKGPLGHHRFRQMSHDLPPAADEPSH